MILFWVNIIVLSLLLIAGGILYLLHTKMRKIETIAVITNDDGFVLDNFPIKLDEKVFTYKNRTYNTMRPKIRIGVKSYIFYKSKYADPIKLEEMSDSRMTADVYHAIINTEVIKRLNNYSSGLPFELNAKTILIGGGIILAIGFMFMLG